MERNRPRDITCPSCGGAVSPDWDPFSRAWHYPGFDEAAKLCSSCRRIADIAGNIEHHLRRSGVPSKYVGCSFETYFPPPQLEQAFDVCRRYAMDPVQSLFMYGSYGTGKTHLAVAVTREFLLRGKDVMFTSVPKLLFEIRKAFQENSKGTEAFYVERYSSFEFLVLDDFGVEKTTEWARQTLDYIIYERDSNLRPMVITSNLSMDEVAEKIDGRISSRLAGMGRIVQFKGPDYRLRRNGLPVPARQTGGRS